MRLSARVVTCKNVGLLAEPARLQELHRYGVLDAPADPRLDDLARAAALACGVPVGLVSLVDKERHFFLARTGIDLVEAPRKNGFCNAAIAAESLFEVEDAALDARFATHPMVTQDPHVRFYAAAPLVSKGGAAIGTLCVIDWQPGKLSEEQRSLLQLLGRQAMDVLEQRRRALLRARAQQALDGDLRSHLENVAGYLGKLSGSARDLSCAMLATDAALQTLDDAVEVLDERGSGLNKKPGDLAVACRDLAGCYQLPDRPPLFFTATGDCRGLWDLDRLTRALDAFLEGAQGPVRICVRGLEDKVELAIRAQALADDGLRADAALQIFRAHGGGLEWTRHAAAVSLTVVLPR